MTDHPLKPETKAKLEQVSVATLATSCTVHGSGRGGKEHGAEIRIPEHAARQHAFPIAEVQVRLHLEVAYRPEADRDQEQERKQKEQQLPKQQWHRQDQ